MATQGGIFARLDGQDIPFQDIASASGLRARIIAYGAALQSLVLPEGADVVLGYDTLEPYLTHPVYIGAVIGRYANRIANAAFTLDGKRYDLVACDGPNTLHGGAQGFDKRIWRFVDQDAPNMAVLTYSSADGEQGFPGALDVRVTYELNTLALRVTLEAVTTKPTIVCLTHHAYFNLAGDGDVLHHELEIPADAITPINANFIPTGELRTVAGTPFDFRTPHAIGARIAETHDEQIRIAGGYDHNFALHKGRTKELGLAARLRDPVSGRALELSTTEPGLQFYSGNFLSGETIGKTGVRYSKHAGLCLEPQVFPDAPNQPHFPSARLDPGQVYRHVSEYKFIAPR